MPTVAISIANPDPNDCPKDFPELVALLRQLITSTVEGASTPYVVQSAEPGVDDQNYIWFKIDGTGRPLGIFKFYDGNWRRVDNGRTGEVRVFNGNPAGVFDETGKGILGSAWDGWALMNGQNGTPDVSDRFIIAGHSYSGGWRTDVGDSPLATTGGNASITLSDSNTYRPARPEVKRYKWSADGNTGRNGGNMLGDFSAPGVSEVILPGDAGNTDPDPISIVNPYYAFALVAFIGYD